MMVIADNGNPKRKSLSEVHPPHDAETMKFREANREMRFSVRKFVRYSFYLTSRSLTGMSSFGESPFGSQPYI